MKTNTKIYTEEFVLKELSLLLKTLKENKDIVYLWELFEDKNYTRFRFSEWVKEYKDSDEIQRISHTIKEILETRAIWWAMRNNLNPTATIFHLKNNYNWVDKQTTENTTKIDLTLSEEDNALLDELE